MQYRNIRVKVTGYKPQDVELICNILREGMKMLSNNSKYEELEFLTNGGAKTDIKISDMEAVQLSLESLNKMIDIALDNKDEELFHKLTTIRKRA